MIKLTNGADIKKYVKNTIRRGNKKEIKLVLDKYWEYLQKESNKSYQEALEIFK